jgi:hypothetical protein
MSIVPYLVCTIPKPGIEVMQERFKKLLNHVTYTFSLALAKTLARTSVKRSRTQISAIFSEFRGSENIFRSTTAQRRRARPSQRH